MSRHWSERQWQTRSSLVPYAGRFDGFHAIPASVSKTCPVRFDNNRYSVAASAVGRPAEIRAYAERVELWQEGRMRDECRNEHLFFSMGHARAVIAGWVTDYNTQRPHSAIGYRTPAAYAAALNTQRPSTLRSTEGSAPVAVAHAAHMRNAQPGIPVADG